MQQHLTNQHLQTNNNITYNNQQQTTMDFSRGDLSITFSEYGTVVAGDDLCTSFGAGFYQFSWEDLCSGSHEMARYAVRYFCQLFSKDYGCVIPVDMYHVRPAERGMFEALRVFQSEELLVMAIIDWYMAYRNDLEFQAVSSDVHFRKMLLPNYECEKGSDEFDKEFRRMRFPKFDVVAEFTGGKQLNSGVGNFSVLSLSDEIIDDGHFVERGVRNFEEDLEEGCAERCYPVPRRYSELVLRNEVRIDEVFFRDLLAKDIIRDISVFRDKRTFKKLWSIAGVGVLGFGEFPVAQAMGFEEVKRDLKTNKTFYNLGISLSKVLCLIIGFCVKFIFTVFRVMLYLLVGFVSVFKGFVDNIAWMVSNFWSSMLSEEPAVNMVKYDSEKLLIWSRLLINEIDVYMLRSFSFNAIIYVILTCALVGYGYCFSRRKVLVYGVLTVHIVISSFYLYVIGFFKNTFGLVDFIDFKTVVWILTTAGWSHVCKDRRKYDYTRVYLFIFLKIFIYLYTVWQIRLLLVYCDDNIRCSFTLLKEIHYFNLFNKLNN